MNKRVITLFISNGARIFFLLFALSVPFFAQGKNPVILIPGLSGSELRHKDSNFRIWFKTVRSKTEDLKLPVQADPTKSRDALIATDVLRNVKIGIFPITDVYGGFIKAMEERGGYHEEKWLTPSADGDHDSLYVFPYDWRLDNVGNARILVKQIEELKRILKKPNLKFDIVAHSMGGLISRYAAMYGDADLPAGNRTPVPTWAGAKNFGKVILLGTPNEGSALALSNIVNGFTLGGLRLDLPFVQDTSKYTVFTIPSAYQLLPAPGTIRAFDDQLKPLALDIYDTKTWAKYKWGALYDPKFTARYTSVEQKAAPAYFANVLARAKRFHLALAATGGRPAGLDLYLVGADCKPALDGILIYEDKKTGGWKTLFKADGFTRQDGTKVKDEELRTILQSAGDGVVAERSLKGMIIGQKTGSEVPEQLVCEDHNKLAANSKIQDYIIGVLNGKGTVEPKIEEKKENGKR